MEVGVLRFKNIVPTVAALVLMSAGVATADTPTTSTDHGPQVHNAVRLAVDPMRDAVAAAAYGHIVNDNSGLCLAVPGGSLEPGVGLNQYWCGTWADHFWR